MPLFLQKPPEGNSLAFWEPVGDDDDTAVLDFYNGVINLIKLLGTASVFVLFERNNFSLP